MKRTGESTEVQYFVSRKNCDRATATSSKKMSRRKQKDCGPKLNTVSPEQLAETPFVKANPQVWFEISINGRVQSDIIVMELYADAVPDTVENFRQLCTGEAGSGEVSGMPLHFRGSSFHRIIPGFMCQGGDITKGDGTGGESIYGEVMEDESFEGKAGRHTGRGCLSLANSGPNTNNSQFFICTGPTEWLDGKHVVFGRVIKGLECVDKMEAQGMKSGEVCSPVIIIECGEVSSEDKIDPTVLVNTSS